MPSRPARRAQNERVPLGVIKDASWEIPIKEGLNGKTWK